MQIDIHSFIGQKDSTAAPGYIEETTSGTMRCTRCGSALYGSMWYLYERKGNSGINMLQGPVCQQCYLIHSKVVDK